MATLTKQTVLDVYSWRIDPPPSFFELDPDGDFLALAASGPENLKPEARAPFSTSGMLENPHEKEWVYLDEDGDLQGPFSTLDMDQWYNNGYFDLDLLVGLNTRDRLIPLRTLIEVSGLFRHCQTSD